MTASRVLFVGIGSPHGDDQAGWAVADDVTRRAVDGMAMSVRKAHEPAELLDWLEGVERLHICDACLTDAPVGEFAMWRFPDAVFEETRFASTHGIPLPAVLRLSVQLGTLPSEVVIWGISISCAAPGGDLSPLVQAAVPQVANRICEVLGDA